MERSFWDAAEHPSSTQLWSRASSGSPQTPLWRGGMGEKKKRILICFMSHNCFLYHVLQVHIWVKKLHNGHKRQIWGKKVIMQNRQLEQISLWLKMAIIGQKTDFLPSRNSLFIAAKATQNSRQTFQYFPPTVWKYGKRKSCHNFFFPLVLPEVTLFFSSVNKWQSMILLVLGTEDRPSKEKSLDGRQSAGNCKPAKKTEAPSTGCLYNISLFEYDENIICLIDHQLPK